MTKAAAWCPMSEDEIRAAIIKIANAKIAAGTRAALAAGR